MRPSIQPGDVCVVLLVGRPPRVGDVVLYERSGWPGGVLHRVIEVRWPEATYRLQGDANPTPDRDAVDRARVRGRVVAVARTGRMLSRWLSAVHALNCETNPRLRR